MIDDYVSVSDFAAEVGLSSQTIYRYLKSVPNPQKRTIDRRAYYHVDTLHEALRRERILGVRDIQHKLNVSLRDLKSAGMPGYAVDKKGRVYNTSKQSAKCLTPKTRADGYVVVRLNDYGTHYVHRLVAYAFLGYPFRSTEQVDHIDGDKSNNSASNLRWVSPGENISSRDRRNFPSAKQPNKYTASELSQLNEAFARGWTFREFQKRHSKVEISASHYNRKKAEFGLQGDFPEWHSVPVTKRYGIVWRYLAGYPYDLIARQMPGIETIEGWRDGAASDYPAELLPCEFAMIAHWADYLDLRDDYKAHVAVIGEYARRSGAEDLLEKAELTAVDTYSAKLRETVGRNWIFCEESETWWIKDAHKGRATRNPGFYAPTVNRERWLASALDSEPLLVLSKLGLNLPSR